MNRRRFLELLGQAAVGTGIVYSFPSIIVPKNIVLPETWYNTDSNIITFKKLNEAYQKLTIGSSEPNLLIVNKSTYAYIVEKLYRPEERFIGKHGGLIFRGSEIKINEYLKDGEITGI